MSKMSWTIVIADLVATGMTQPEIARLCECSQSALSDLARGVTRDPRHSTGQRLLRLREERCPAVIDASSQQQAA